MIGRRFISLALLLTCATAASASPCAMVKDHDQRQECRAVERQSEAACASIKDHDARQLCRARTRQ